MRFVGLLLAVNVVPTSVHAADPAHWAYAPIRRPALPTIQTPASAASPIDYFILKKLDSKGITPSPEADPASLLRRVTLDLIGIPPTPQELEKYLSDRSPDRYDRAVERLLSSPHYGERWARPWMDLCHYADTDGYLTDQLRPVAWRYRSWLIRALNRNLPFDQFTIQQLAGDQLPQASLDQRMATGFLRQTLSNREGGAEPEEFRVKQVIDRTEMVGTIWLGLTVGCARCHDHKYDRVSQEEFFSLYACLNNADEVNVDAPLPGERQAWQRSRASYRKERAAIIQDKRHDIEALQKRWEAKCLEAWKNPGKNHIWDRQWELLGLVWGGGLGEGQLEGAEIAKLPWRQRTAQQKSDLLDYFLSYGSVVDPERFKQLGCSELRNKLQQLKRKYPSATRAPVMQTALNPRKTHIHLAGDFRDAGALVGPGTPEVLPSFDVKGEPSRLALAKWLVSSNQPLTARVTVNRYWEQFFGQGLVQTTEDFGVRGTPPSHPDLLDYLAAEWVSSGWDVKELHRVIVTSTAYRRSSETRSDLKELDPGNELLARQNALRLSAEMVRDSALAVSGLWQRRIGGPSVRPPQPARVTEEGFGNHKWDVSPGADRYRRSVYTFTIRTTPFAQGILFDAPNPNEICTRRVRSNTPLQALVLLNDPMFFECAQAFGKNALDHDGSDKERVQHLFRFGLGRNPTAEEVKTLVNYVEQQRKGISLEGSKPLGEQEVWTRAASVVLNLHEFVTRH